MICFLRNDSDCLSEAKRFTSILAAKHRFGLSARELAGYGQTHVATIHIADTIEELNEVLDDSGDTEEEK